MEAVKINTEEGNVLDDPLIRLRARARNFEDDADPYVRGLIATRIYRDTPDLPVVMKRAEIMAQTLEQIKPMVMPEERILGAVYRRRKVHQGISDSEGWRIQVFYPEKHQFREDWPIPQEVKDELRWWRDHPLNANAQNTIRQQNLWLARYGIAWPHGMVNGHTLPDHGILLKYGISALRLRLRDRLSSPHTDRQQQQWLAMDRCLEGLSQHILHFARAAYEKAQTLTVPLLRSRLELAARNGFLLSEQAPQTFLQALQLLHFSNFADVIDCPGDASSFGRIDQLLIPFYEEDMTHGLLTREEAFNMVAQFLVKRWTSQDSNNMTLGGMTPFGMDATNELSYIFLEAMEAIGMAADISVRLHKDSPQGFIRTTARVIRCSLGRPSVYNDEIVIKALQQKGIDLEDARDYAPLGCVEVMIPGRSAYRTMCLGLNLPKVFELVVNRGHCLVTGDKVWDDVPNTFDTYDDIMKVYRYKVQSIVDLAVDIIREDERIEPDIFPRPWLTVLSRGGIESGVDMTAGQPKYDPVGVTLESIADIANSLYAVNDLVYAKHVLTLDDLRNALEVNWEGYADVPGGSYEVLRQYVLHRLPRYGQDLPEINAIARKETDFFASCFDGKRTLYGGCFMPMIFGVATGILYNKSPKTGATPSGNRRGDMLAMSLQPNYSGAQGCTTAVLCSAAQAVDGHLYPGGISNVQECDPSLVAGQTGLDRLVDLIRGFMRLGGVELSMNFLDENMLRSAQRDPDRYRYLMVRVFGLSAQFVNLSPELQETVILRVASSAKRA